MIEITTAALIPVLAGRAANIPNFTLIVASLGSMNAITAGLMYLYRFEQNWHNYRSTCEMLRQHKFLYQTRTSPSNGDDPFHAPVQGTQ